MHQNSEKNVFLTKFGGELTPEEKIQEILEMETFLSQGNFDKRKLPAHRSMAYRILLENKN